MNLSQPLLDPAHHFRALHHHNLTRGTKHRRASRGSDTINLPLAPTLRQDLLHLVQSDSTRISGRLRSRQRRPSAFKASVRSSRSASSFWFSSPLLTVLNTAGNSYEPDQISSAYSAAESLGGFQFFYSFDFSHAWSVSEIASYISAHAASTATYKWNNAVLVSSFSGESNGDSFWSSVKSTLSSDAITISLAPAFISYRDPSQAQTLLNNFPSIDGFTNWWSWPADNGNLLTTDTDLAYQSAVKSSRSGSFIMGTWPYCY